MIKSFKKRHNDRAFAFGDMLVSVRSKNENKVYFGTLIDKSATGAGIVVPKPLVEGEDVEIDCQAHWGGYRRARVEWCDEIGDKLFKVGISFTGTNMICRHHFLPY
jgi:hypothetical protein